MNTADKLKLFLAACKCGVSVNMNEHREVYETAAQRIAEAAGYECPPEIADAVRDRMIETDTIITIHFYPKHPVTFYEVWHYDLDAALDEAIECLRQEGLLPPDNGRGDL